MLIPVGGRRLLVATAEVQAADWVETGIGEILHFQETPRRMETRYQVEHMSLAVLPVPPSLELAPPTVIVNHIAGPAAAPAPPAAPAEGRRLSFNSLEERI